MDAADVPVLPPALPVAAQDLGERARRAWSDPVAAARGALTEVVALGEHLWLYPQGFGREHISARGVYTEHRTDRLPLAQRGLAVTNMPEAVTPVLLVHGINDNRSAFVRLRRALHRRGYGVVHAVNYSVLTPVRSDVRAAARELAAHVDRLRQRTGADTVHVVGHSLGGLVARYFVQCLGGHEAVGALVTMGTAHHGSLVASVLPPTPLVRQLRPGSDLVEELGRPAPGCRTRILSVWSHGDPLMVPRSSARLDHPDLRVEHLELDHVGHLAMVGDPRVHHRLLTWLGRGDEQRRSA
jgi:triacylglycerol lipase